MMKYFFWAIFISGILISCQTKTEQIDTRQTETADLETLRHLKEVNWPKAYREQDTVLLDKILADEFQMIDASGGWYTKADEITYIKEHKPSYDSFHYEIKRLEIFNGNTAIISGTGHIEGRNDDGPYKSIYQSSNVLIKENGEWKAISSHVSGIEEVD